MARSLWAVAHLAVRRYVADIKPGDRIWFGPLPSSDGGWSDPVHEVETVKATKGKPAARVLTLRSGHRLRLPEDSAIIVRLEVEAEEVQLHLPDDRPRPDLVEAHGLHDKLGPEATGTEVIAELRRRGVIE